MFFPAKKYGEDADQQLSFPFQCSFWALGDTRAHAKRTVKGDSIILGSMVSTLQINTRFVLTQDGMFNELM